MRQGSSHRLLAAAVFGLLWQLSFALTYIRYSDTGDDMGPVVILPNRTAGWTLLQNGYVYKVRLPCSDRPISSWP